jgi:formiminotetrahydrofolate cyclodeaminase
MTEPLEPSFPKRNIGSYFEALSSGTPAPGGGSAAGLTGALGCALGSMVCNLSLRREHDDSIDDLRQTFLALQSSLLDQAIADERVFRAYRDATSLPRSTDSEKSARRGAIESALVEAAEVPERMIALGLEAMFVLQATAQAGTLHALGDLLTGGYLLQAMVLGALENIEANAALMKVGENKARFEQAATSARHDLAAELSALEAVVANRRA